MVIYGVDITGSLFVSGSSNFKGDINVSGSQIVSGSLNVLNSLLLNGQPFVGTQGPQGIQGSIGIQGTTGSNGVQGNQGPTGLQGTTGAQGNQGPTGLQGSTGVQGNQGPTGIQGTNGTVGTQGNQGPTGLQGSTGLQGNQGSTGTSAGITSYTNPSDNRVLTSVSSTSINAESNLTFDGSTLTLTGNAVISSVLDVNSFIRNTDSTANSSIIIAAQGTSHYIQSRNASNTAYTNLLLNPNGSNVGIGTTSPTRKLEVHNSATNAEGFRVIQITGGRTSGGALGLFYDDQVGTTQPTLQVIQNGTGDILQLLDGAAQVVTVKDGGNVGIGQVNPGAKLDIVSTGAGSEGLRVDGTGGGFAFVVKGGSDYTSHIRAGATIGVNYFTTPPSNGLIVEGNVGIGTSSPTYKLDVNGTGRFSGALSGTSASFSSSITINSIGSAINLIQSAVGSATYYVMQNTVETGGKRYRFGYTGGSLDKGSFSIYNETDNIMPFLISSTGAATFSSNITGNANIIASTGLRIRKNTTSDGANDLGIFYSNSGDTFYFYDWNTATKGLALNTGTGAATFSGSVTATNAMFNGVVTINNNIRGFVLNRDAVTNYNGIGYQTATVQHWFVGMRENLSSNDYVIYNESGYDNFKLSKSTGAATFSSSVITGSWISTPNNYGLTATNAAGTAGRVLIMLNTSNQIEIGRDSDISQIRMGTASANDALTITSGGNVGIGTTSPTRRLHIVSSDDTRGIMVEQTSASSYAEVHFKANREYRIGTGGSTSAAEAANNWYVYDSTAALQRFVITSAGNVGIGTTSPTSNLSFDGSAVRTIGMERVTASNTAGNSLTISASSATVGATDKNGGDMILSGGAATGTGSSRVVFRTATPNFSSGTGDRTPSDKVIITGSGTIIQNGVSSTFVTGTCLANQSVNLGFTTVLGGRVRVHAIITPTDGTSIGAQKMSVIANSTGGISEVVISNTTTTTIGSWTFSGSGEFFGVTKNAGSASTACTYLIEVIGNLA